MKEKIASSVDTSSWTTFRGYTFSIKYPSNLVTIKGLDKATLVGDYRPNAQQYEIKSINSSHSAYFYAEDLNGSYTFGTKGISTIYEPYSNVWWDQSEFRINFLDIKNCYPNSIGKTTGGYDIYGISGGDMGNFDVHYSIVMRNLKAQKYTPSVYTFKTGGDVNDASYSTYTEFEKILESIVQSLEAKEI